MASPYKEVVHKIPVMPTIHVLRNKESICIALICAEAMKD
jgi:hypothetical protein